MEGLREKMKTKAHGKTPAHGSTWKHGIVVEENTAHSGMLICGNMTPEKIPKASQFSPATPQSLWKWFYVCRTENSMFPS